MIAFFFGTDFRKAKVVKLRSGEEEEAVIFAFFVIVFERENLLFLIKMIKFIWKLFGNFFIILFTLYNLYNVLG